MLFVAKNGFADLVLPDFLWITLFSPEFRQIFFLVRFEPLDRRCPVTRYKKAADAKFASVPCNCACCAGLRKIVVNGKGRKGKFAFHAGYEFSIFASWVMLNIPCLGLGFYIKYFPLTVC